MMNAERGGVGRLVRPRLGHGPGYRSAIVGMDAAVKLFDTAGKTTRVDPEHRLQVAKPEVETAGKVPVPRDLPGGFDREQQPFIRQTDAGGSPRQVREPAEGARRSGAKRGGQPGSHIQLFTSCSPETPRPG